MYQDYLTKINLLNFKGSDFAVYLGKPCGCKPR